MSQTRFDMWVLLWRRYAKKITGNHFNAISKREDEPDADNDEYANVAHMPDENGVIVLRSGELAPSRYDTFRNYIRCLGKPNAWKRLRLEVQKGKVASEDEPSSVVANDAQL